MQVYCVFQVFEVPSLDKDGNIEGVDTVDSLMAIYENEEDAKQLAQQFTKNQPDVITKVQVWNVQ